MSAGYRTIIALALTAAIAGCAGNGKGLDANGSAGSGGPPPLTADFQSIQENIFTPICTKCHIGAAAPLGLQLDAAHSYSLLVGVPSVEQPNVLRVQAGNPDSSYIIRKLQGTPGISGGQMPLGGPYLPQSTIDVIRQWITNGAQPSAAAAVAAAVKATQRFAVISTSPDNDSIVNLAPPEIIVAFSSDVDSNLLSNTTVALEKTGASDPRDAMALRAMVSSGSSPSAGMVASSELAAGAATHQPATITVPAGNPSAILITPRTALDNGTYRVTLHGSLADMNAQALGSDYVFTFTVEKTP
jgi:hypothetical protein